jgi:hypothetical protein
MSWSDAERERQQAKRDAFRRQGLTSKGKKRKPRYVPKPSQAPTFYKAPSTQPEQPKAQPRTPMNVLKRPPKLPRIAPLTDEDREAA